MGLLWFVLVLLLVAIITKTLGCGVPAVLQHMNIKESLIVGMGMVPRGEVALIIALIGVQPRPHQPEHLRGADIDESVDHQYSSP
jgi:Kef-type K+ transport system membrane component KefB